LRNPEQTLSTIKHWPSPRNKAAHEIVSGSWDIEQKTPSQPAIDSQPIRALWPWAFLALAGILTFAWAITLCWAAVALAQWLAG
jgi:hypothetical protein